MSRPIFVLVALALATGCGSVLPQAGYETGRSPQSASQLAKLAVDEDAPQRAPNEHMITGGNDRKVIYTASLEIVVDEFSGVEQVVSTLVQQYGGFIASANVSLNQGSQRSGVWIVRVPVDSFSAFLEATGDLGVPERREQHGQDVTEEFVDLEARISSKKKLEERILELLASNKGEIKDVIEVERELSRVRTEIEQMEGRLRYLADRTDLTTVTLSVREERDYTPPQAPGLGARIASTWQSSTGAIVAVAQNLVLAAVACLPWLVMVGVVAIPLWKWHTR